MREIRRPSERASPGWHYSPANTLGDIGFLLALSPLCSLRRGCSATASNNVVMFGGVSSARGEITISGYAQKSSSILIPGLHCLRPTRVILWPRGVISLNAFMVLEVVCHLRIWITSRLGGRNALLGCVWNNVVTEYLLPSIEGEVYGKLSTLSVYMTWYNSLCRSYRTSAL